jgi:hypothetical protein
MEKSTGKSSKKGKQVAKKGVNVSTKRLEKSKQMDKLETEKPAGNPRRKKQIDKLRHLMDELTPEDAEKIPTEDVLKLRRKMNPYGLTVEGSGEILTFSITNFEKKYLEKLITTAMIGFLFRKCDEWHVPLNIKPIHVQDYLENKELIEIPGDMKETEELKRQYEENKQWMEKRLIVYQFLEEQFKFNPDEHVRSAYIPNFKDKERKVIETPTGQLAMRHFARHDKEFSRSYTEYLEAKLERENREKTAQTKKDGKKKIDKKPKMKMDRGKEESKLIEVLEKERKLYDLLVSMIPSYNIFFELERYREKNLEILKDAVRDLYCEKPDYEFLINPYKMHKNEDEADAFIDKYKDEVIATVYKATTGKWNPMPKYDPTGENVRFFTDKTYILEEMLKEIKRGEQFAEDVRRKTIKKRKKKNIEEAGPDDPAFIQWKKNNPTFKELGLEELEESDDEPENAIMIEEIKISDGGTKLEKSHFWTEAEAPKIPNPDDPGLEEKKE